MSSCLLWTDVSGGSILNALCLSNNTEACVSRATSGTPYFANLGRLRYSADLCTYNCRCVFIQCTPSMTDYPRCPASAWSCRFPRFLGPHQTCLWFVRALSSLTCTTHKGSMGYLPSGGCICARAASTLLTCLPPCN